MRASHRTKLRDELFHGSSREIFAPSVKSTVGFCRPPRSIALVAGLADLEKRKQSPGRLYLSLWTHDFGDGIIEVDPVLQIYEADPLLSSSRADRNFADRIAALTELGLVRTQARGHRDVGYVLLVDPHLAVERLRAALEARQWWTRWWAAYESRCREAGIELDLYKRKAAEIKAATDAKAAADTKKVADAETVADPRAAAGIKAVAGAEVAVKGTEDGGAP